MNTLNDVAKEVSGAVQHRAARAKALEQLTPVISTAFQSQALAAAADVDAVLAAFGTRVVVTPAVKRASDLGSRSLAAALRARSQITARQAAVVDQLVRAWKG